ncbi:endonuclease/exonuclease/phosphatase family protein [Massilia orientalis]|uniref:Endonuclease/exonuclease/phosphatase family protein n=1 Tax=Massilia orientalis TaxID=3050128 RepID=A0ACC7M3V5_9BURK|nr:endonuclease/exonuclease/phosphatase family protein [Massilia sp. YIM B02787]
MLTLLTWNIQCARTPDDGADLDRVADRVLAFGARFDILLLQEVGCGLPARDGRPVGDQFAGLARRLDHLHAASAFALDTRNPDGSPRRLGCMTFARGHIVHVRRHALPWPPDPGVPAMPRAALETVIATADGMLRVLNIHLEYFSARQRMAQVEHLRALQAEAHAHAGVSGARAAAPDGPGGVPFAPLPHPAAAVLAGDFNMAPGSDGHARLLAPGPDGGPLWRDAWELAHPGEPHAPTVGLHDTSAELPCTFDYACVSPALAPRVRRLRVDTAAAGSDHQPLLLELA